MPNRYLLTDYSPAEIAALPDEPLLWWLTWQAMGHEIIDCGICQYIERYGSWNKDSAGPSGHRGDQSRPSLESVLHCIHTKMGPDGGYLTTYLGSSISRSIFIIAFEEEWEVRAQAEGEPLEPWPYLAACRALLAWKRGRG